MVLGRIRNRLRPAKAEAAIEVPTPPAPSPNPMTNLILADVALRTGGQVLRHAVERTLLGTRYPKDKARAIVKGRNMTQTLLGTAAARIATRSVPGALIVGGGLLAKALYDRRKGREAARTEGQQQVEKQVAAGQKADDKPA